MDNTETGKRALDLKQSIDNKKSSLAIQQGELNAVMNDTKEKYKLDSKEAIRVEIDRIEKEDAPRIEAHEKEKAEVTQKIIEITGR